MARPPRRRPARPAVRAAGAPRIVDVLIESVGARGDGIARLGEGTVFVGGTAPGDRVRVRLDGRRGEGLAGTLVELLEAGPDRVEPLCRHFGDCGGCALQHLSAARHDAWKSDLLITALARQGLPVDGVRPLASVPAGTRRRATFAFVRAGKGTIVGFNARLSDRIVDVAECPLLDPTLTALLTPLRTVLADVGTGLGGDVTVTRTEGGLDVLVQAEARLDIFDRERLAAFADSSDLARLSWRRPGEEAEPLVCRRPAVVTMGGVAVEPPAGGFLQPSAEGERLLAGLVVEAVGGAPRVADLFAGCGSFTFPLAATAAVHAVEGDAAALGALRAAAHRAGLKVTCEARDLARRPLIGPELKAYDAVVFDPPRAGAAPQAQALADAGPPLVVAVSCSPATLARDAAILVAGGYALVAVTPVDQFPWSAHLEAVAVFRRR
ncbi:MAG: class I SAM-dependent RNA methyltransferase [Rhodospirillales bacterium]|nr:class I SAM-dependent RNA methyltransferase [Rhodospirillales bacterium]